MKFIKMPESITFGAVGDIGIYKGVADLMITKGMDQPFEKMKPYLDQADLLFGNLETVMVPPDYPKEEIDPKGLITPIPGPECIEAIKRSGFDFLNLATNHVLDAGVLGMKYTKNVLEQGGIITGGVGNTQEEAHRLVTIEKSSILFGFLCYCEDSNYSLGKRGPCHAYYTTDTVLKDISNYRDCVDILVVSIHADIEFMPTPSMPRIKSFRRIAKAGADIILGHHPHVPQGCEILDGCLVAYSLGNFVFPAHSMDYMKNNGPHTGQSFLLLVDVAKDGVRSFERVPFEILKPPEERPTPLKEEKYEKMLAYLAEIDGYLYNETFLRKTWRNVAKCQLESYIKLAIEPEQPQRLSWKKALARILGLPSAYNVKVNVERIIEDFVGRLCLTAENRNWMEEILKMGQEAWDIRNSQESDLLHRPQHFFTNKRSGKIK